MGVLVFHPPRNGPTIWEIGVPDRTAAEFYVPEPNPTLMNQLYASQRTESLVRYLLSSFFFFLVLLYEMCNAIKFVILLCQV
jgi:hypothetical protein